MKRIKAAVCLLITGILTAGSFLAAFGCFSDGTLASNQNLFGGNGEIIGFTNSMSNDRPLLHDDNTLYFPYMSNELELYAYDIETESAEEVCTGILCDHSGYNCPLSPLYETGALRYFPLDEFLYSIRKTDDKLLLRRWNVRTNKAETVTDYPKYTKLTDSLGMVYQTENNFNTLERLDENTIFVHCGNTGFFYNNDFNLLNRIPLDFSHHVFAWSEEYLFWSIDGQVCCFDRNTNTISYDVLSHAANKPVQLASYQMFGFQGELYCKVGEAIVRYNPKQDTLISVMPKTEKMTLFSLIGDRLYYHQDGKIYEYHVISGKSTVMSDLTEVPSAEWKDNLIISTPMPGHPESQIQLYKKGQAVT